MMDDNKDFITASWARKTAEDQLGARAKTQLTQCLNQIESAVKSNQLNTNITMYAESVVIKELERRGFKIQQMNEQRDGSYLKIEW